MQNGVRSSPTEKATKAKCNDSNNTANNEGNDSNNNAKKQRQRQRTEFNSVLWSSSSWSTSFSPRTGFTCVCWRRSLRWWTSSRFSRRTEFNGVWQRSWWSAGEHLSRVSPPRDADRQPSAARVPTIYVVREPGGASDPVHRRSAGHASCDSEMGTHSANCAENRRDSSGAFAGQGC